MGAEADISTLILRNSGGGITLTVDIEVVLSVYLLNDTRHRFYGDVHIVFQIVQFALSNGTRIGKSTLLTGFGDDETEHQGLRPDCAGSL